MLKSCSDVDIIELDRIIFYCHKDFSIIFQSQFFYPNFLLMDDKRGYFPSVSMCIFFQINYHLFRCLKINCSIK